jgi:hypothetical protein
MSGDGGERAGCGKNVHVLSSAAWANAAKQEGNRFAA